VPWSYKQLSQTQPSIKPHLQDWYMRTKYTNENYKLGFITDECILYMLRPNMFMKEHNSNNPQKK